MKRSEMVDLILSELEGYLITGNNSKHHAVQMLTKIEQAGMLPPTVLKMEMRQVSPNPCAPVQWQIKSNTWESEEEEKDNDSK